MMAAVNMIKVLKSDGPIYRENCNAYPALSSTTFPIQSLYRTTIIYNTLMMSGHEKFHSGRPRTPISSAPAKEVKPPKHRERNRLRKHITKRSVDRITLSSSSSDGKDVTPTRNSTKFGDPDITPRPLNFSKALPSKPLAGRESVDLQLRETMQSRWSTSTSDVTSGVSRKESKRKIFGITVPFKRRVKSEQIPARLKISSGFFGGRFAGSKLSLSLTSPKYNHTTDRQWQSSRASSSMTARGEPGALSDEDTPTEHRRFEVNFDETPRFRIPQRRHTLTGNLLGMSSLSSSSELEKSPSRHSSTSLNSSAHPDNRAFVQNFLSLFPKPPRRDSADVMQMAPRNNTIPLLYGGDGCLPGQQTRGFSNPLPVNLRASYLQLPNQWQAGVSTDPISFDLPNHSQFGHDVKSSVSGLDSYTTPIKRNSTIIPASEPRSILYTSAHRKPVLTHLDLQVTADIDAIEVAEVREIWVAVELNGSLANNRDTAHAKVNGLDVLFLLDLSQNMSDQAILTMKSTVGYILENISGTRSDSFGMAAFTSTSACEVLMPIVPCTHQAKHRAFSLLDKAKTTNDPFLLENPISNVVRAACSMFMPGFQGKNKNLIILSSAVPANQNSMADIGGFEDVRIHVIGVGCVYWPISEIIYADARDGGGGFCFPTAMMDVTTLEDDHSTKLQSITRRFVRALRSSESIGMMRDVNISLSPTKNTEIKAIIGRTSLATFRPGERATVMVRMDVKSVYQKHHSVSEDGLEALEEGLYAALGMEKMKLLQVDVAYKHSLFPAGTTLTTTAVAEATIITKDSLWNPTYAGSRVSSIYEYDNCRIYTSSKLLGNISPTPRQNFVRKALIQKIVSEHKNPKDALIAIENIARTTEEKDFDYCNVVRELRYQIRIWNGRRRGRVLGFGSGVSDITFQGVQGLRIPSTERTEEEQVKTLARPFSFEVNGESLLERKPAQEEGDDGREEEIQREQDEGPPTPGLTNDSHSVEEEAEGAEYPTEDDERSITRRFEGESGVDSSPMTVVALDRDQQRADDSATRLWKRIERAGEVGSIGRSSVGTMGTRNTNDVLQEIEGLGLKDTDTDSDVGGKEEEQPKKESQKEKKKNRKKRKKNRGKSNRSSVTTSEPKGGGGTGIVSPAGTLRDVRETEFPPFMI
ncbi:hypothetical protein TWF730_004431 [Orbilia blumenaviensis]|uniref:VWFA domain-containing protein n=1 Tax=Orbilia blumenaviensis TaxID=1796055 RepID=A0AAV9U272_9PEZI